MQNKLKSKDKFDFRSRKCLFLGYPSSHKEGKLYDLETRTFFVSWDAFFQEHIFPFEHIGNTNDKDASPNLRITYTGDSAGINVSTQYMFDEAKRRSKISQESSLV